MIDYADLMTKAAYLRNEMGEDAVSPIDIFALSGHIEGLTIVYYPLGNNLSGMCIKGRENNNLVAINSSMTYGRQRFSMAHEFYHLYFDDSMVAVCAKKINSGAEVEKSADMFASYFLMPDVALIQQVERLVEKNQKRLLNLTDVIQIEQYFGVSHQAAVIRLMNTEYLNHRTGEEMLRTPVRTRAEALGYSPELYLPSPEEKKYKTYGNYIYQAEQLKEKNMISNGKYEELLLDAFRSDLVYGDGDEESDVID